MNKHTYAQENHILIPLFEIFICIYIVRGGIDQISTNAPRYSTCCAADVYISVYIFIGAHIVPLKGTYGLQLRPTATLS